MDITMLRKAKAAVLLSALTLTACAGFDLGQLFPDVGATTPPTLTESPLAPDGPTLNPAEPAPETPMIMCTPPACAPGEVYACPSGDCPGGCGTVCAAPTSVSGPLEPAPADWEALESWLATVWRNSINPAAVRAALQQSGLQKSLDDWRAADFDGDLQDDWVAVLYDPSMPGVPFGAAGDLWIVNGDGAVFRYYTAPSSDIYEFIAPNIVAVTDLTGDGFPELIADATICGAHTCFNNYRIIGRRDGQMVDLQLVAAQTPEEGGGPLPISMSYADTRLADVDSDGLPEFLVHGGTIGSVGAGIVRPRTEVWGWDGAAVSLADTILDPTTYRHHILYEANDLMAAGDLDAALALYDTAVNDGALRDDSFVHPPEKTRADISAYAAFRLILIDLLQGNTDRANSRLAWLGATYPGSAAAGAASALVSGWSGPDNVGALCDSIESGLASLDSPTGSLADMGYGNPSLGAGDFCP